MQLTTPDIVYIISSGLSLIMGLYMLLLYYSTKNVKGPGWWAAGSLIVGLALLIRIFSPEHGISPLVISALLNVVGLYIYLAGIWDFKGKKIRKRIIVGLPVFDVAQTAFFMLFIPSHPIRSSIHITILLIYCSIAIYEMFQLKPGQEYLRTIFRINSVSFFIFGLILLLNLLNILQNPGFIPGQINDIGIILFIISTFVMIALTFGFLSAVNLKLYSELEGQLKSRTKFFAIIAHDLRGPVGTIMNFLNLLNTEPDISTKQKQTFLEKIELLSQSTFHLLQNLLEWATKSQNLHDTEKETVDLNEQVVKCTELIQHLTDLKSINLEIKKSSDVLISGNSKMIETVIRNLLSNALKFTPEGGKIVIYIQKEAGEAQLIVEDTGIGIEPEKINHLFSFEKSRSTTGTDGESGSGLGLVLCSEFVKKNDGNISIKSQPNKGTKVTLKFPSLN